VDMELHDFIITAVPRGIPVVLLSAWFSTWKRPGLPPITSSLQPGPGLRRRLRIERHWLIRRRKEWRKDLEAKLRTGFTDRRSVLRRYARTVGFPSGLLQKYNWPPPFTYRVLPVLSMTPERLEFPHRVRAGMEYVGPMVFEGRRDDGSESRAVGVAAVLAEARAASRPLVLCSVSSMRTKDVDFLRRACAAVAARPDWLMIVGLGKSVEAADLGPVADNIHVFSWVPQLQVLAQADCCLNPGGINTINECVHFGVPMVIYSGGLSDQDGCAARVAYHGVGVRGHRADDAEAVTKNIERALEDPEIRSHVQELSEHSRSPAQRDRLVRIIHQHLPSRGSGERES
ncbi:MAG: glycosyltransferase, partial [Gemmatimonadota bacterium]|nr:glycosyltransferase [Gemmatimonadota bacterium]